jgi:RNA polymerase sigma factor (sigma-70 family)
MTSHLETLFGAGTCVGLSDGQLLARYLADHEEAGEQAFEALVTRHGPMVMRVCVNILHDPQDVHDAFQAVFLVLARRAGAIRNVESIGGWLHGVAVRVTARIRLGSIRRDIRERRTIQVAETMALTSPFPNSEVEVEVERAEGAAVVHQEVSRLPDKYRAPIVLCYLEGLTHDEAAARLSWPVGTVRSRLARARDRLRTRLARRGVTSPAVVGPLTGWLAGEPFASSRAVALIPSEWVASVTKAVSPLSAARTAAGGSVGSASLQLAEGVLKAMMLKKLFVAVCAIIPMGMIIALGGGMFLARQSRAQVQNPSEPRTIKNSRPALVTNEPKPIDPLLQELVQAARQRYEAQRAYYEEGRITIDRFMDASEQLELAELRTAPDEESRRAIRQRQLDRLKEIERREKDELEIGKGTVADITEAHYRRVLAEVNLKSRLEDEANIKTILRRLDDLERKVKDIQDANRARTNR